MATKKRAVNVQGAAKTALAVAAPEVGLPVAVAEKALQVGERVLTGDLVVIRKSYPQGTKKHPLPPVEVEYHVNPAGVGLGLAAGAVAVIAGVIAWNGVQTLGGGLQGIKGSPLGDRISSKTQKVIPPPPPPPSGNASYWTCGPECAAAHLLDPWNIPACFAACVKARS